MGLKRTVTRKCFLIDSPPLATGLVVLGPEVAHHVRTVLRLRPGDRIELRDGRGHAWDGLLVEAGGREVRVAVQPKLPGAVESPLRLTLALALARADRMELALRQATEMGVHRFIAFPAERSDYRLSGLQGAKRKERWGRIACEALCQCGRTNLPDLQLCADLGEFLAVPCARVAAAAGGLKLLAREDGERAGLMALFERYRACREVLVVVGPEGGWSQSEGERLQEAGFQPVHLGPRILRLETAAVALLAAVQMLWGDLK